MTRLKSQSSTAARQKHCDMAARWWLLVALLACSAAALPANGARLKRASEPDSAAAIATDPAEQSANQAPAAKPAAATDAKPAAGKTPPLNFTEIEATFRAVLDEPEVVAKWGKMDRQMVEGVRKALNFIFPHMVAMSSDAKVSGSCSGAILKWVLSLKNMRSWAVKMLDAIGKPGAGILEGSLTMFGNYHQCLSVRAPDEDEIEINEEYREYFRGQYCVLQLKPQLPRKRAYYSLNSTYPSLMRQNYKYYERNVYDDLAELAMAFHFVSIRADLCVPSLCSRDDIQRVADYLGSKLEMRAFVSRCELERADSDGSSSMLLSSLDQHQLASLAGLLVLLLLVLGSTLAGLWLGWAHHHQNRKSKRHSLLTAMSLQCSLQQISSVHMERIDDQKPAFLYTLRLIIVVWFCLCELTRQLDFQYLRELLQLRSMIMMWPMQLLVNSQLQFDTLILLTAFTYSYQNINSNLKDLIKYNVAKYFRLMPSIMVLTALVVLAPLLGPLVQSPVWLDFVSKPAEVCRSTGPLNFLFLQNLLNYNQICLPQTWLFCVELQLCLLAIPLVAWLNRHFDLNQGRFRLLSAPCLSLVGAALVGCLLNYLSIRRHQLPAAWFETFPDQDDRQHYFSKHLINAWAHLTPFAVGLFAGHLCRCQSISTFSGRPYGRKCCDTLMWLTALVLMNLLIYSTHAWSLSGASHLESPYLSALYGSLGPLVWSVSCALLLFYLTVPNEKGHRPRLARLMSLDPNSIRLGRLAFLVYLLNPFVNRLVLAAQQVPVFSSLIMLGHTFIGNLVVTFGLALLISCLVELPCRRLIKKLALGGRRHCSNLGIITRQLDSSSSNPRRQAHHQDSFMASKQQQVQQQPML